MADDYCHDSFKVVSRSPEARRHLVTWFITMLQVNPVGQPEINVECDSSDSEILMVCSISFHGSFGALGFHGFFVRSVFKKVSQAISEFRGIS